jgi:hypothetical protein
VQKEECSFLKKRTKKLLSIVPSLGVYTGGPAAARISKSFLVLFFKKEQLPFLPLTGSVPMQAGITSCR